ncbi:beta-galactosidase [Nocardioides bruguierae]|uniref:beta-galactosidase n=1 Tax=Nocardioides bruguierae TaxID=2945102 RepID=UPI002020664F|nr:beta-galactosidase [Nocardioides bruguierae]MCL8025310.1 beta-galactosidase [Nocardioides bruguierae]
MTTSRHLPDRILFGAAFYDEYREIGSLDHDLDLMVEAGFTVIRVGESVWSTWEPRPGEFDLEWLTPVLDGAHRRGLAVVLGTPTYAVPAWLSTMHPEIAAQDATGRRVPWGQRQEVDLTAPAFRFHAERVIRKQVERHGSHPAVIGFQVDNEPGLHLLHNPGVHAGFLRWLEDRYGSVEELNRRWGLTYWSHRITSWEQLWTPDGNHSPQYQLEWRRYQAQVVTDFIGWQADIVREYAREDQFVTTCISYERPAVDDVSLGAELDVTAGNPYYKMQDGLRIGVEVPREEIWWSSGVWGLFQQGDRMFSTRQEPFLVTETNAQSIGQSHWQVHPPYPGQIALAALSLVSRGARMVEYWQWQTLHHGIETYWGGVLPHSGRPGRIYREIAELGRTLGALGDDLAGYVPDADVAFLYSTDTKRSFEFYPPLAREDGSADPASYLRIFDAFYRAAFETGRQVRMLHPTQLLERDPAALAAELPVMVVPTLYVADDATLDALSAYARAGGHVVVGIRTGYGDGIARARAEVAPGRLREGLGVSYDEYSSLDAPVPVAPVEGGLPGLDAGATGTGWADALEVEGADVLVRYREGIYAGRAAVTTHAVGAGRMTYVGTVPDLTLARALTAWAAPDRLAASWDCSPTVTVASGLARGRRVWFLSNFSPEPATATPTRAVPGTDGSLAAGVPVELDPWAFRVVVEAPDAVVQTPAPAAQSVG